METDITLGSSPHFTLVRVPPINNDDALGWFQQPWIKLGSSITIFKEAKVGYSILIFCVVAVAITYVWAMSLVSLLTRRKEFAILLAVGWRPGQLSKLLFVEATILGSLGSPDLLGNARPCLSNRRSSCFSTAFSINWL